MEEHSYAEKGLTEDAHGDGAWVARQALGELARQDARIEFVLDQDLNRYLLLDGPCELFLGVSRQQLITEVDAWQMALLPGDRTTFTALRQGLLPGIRSQRILRVRTKDGPTRSLRWTMVAQKYLSRNIIVGSVIDMGISECVGCWENMFRLGTEFVHEGFAMTDAEGRFAFLNHEALQIFGYASANELLGKTWRELYSIEVVQRIESDVLPQVRAEGRWRGQLQAQRKDGTQIWLSLSLGLMPTGGIVANYENVSEQVEVAARLNKSECLFREFLNVLPMGVTIRSLEDGYEFVNKATTDFLGEALTNEGSRTGIEVCLTSDPRFDYLRAADQRAAVTGRILRFDHPMTWAGRDLILDVKKLPLRINSSAVTHVCSLINDVTELRRLEREANNTLQRTREFHEMQREFISMVSHEFRTPLTSIHGVNHLIAKRAAQLSPADNADFLRLLGLQIRGLETLKELVDQVLLLNRIEHMSTDAVPKPVKLEEFIRRIVGNLNLALAGERIRLEVKLPVDYAAALDEGQIRAALENLISNALKYSPEQALVDVQVAEVGESWCVVVIDRGRGIPEADRQKLFQPFHRASNVGRVPGTGLGLTIIRRVVDFHQGTLDFTSEVGVGTTFSLTLPRLFAAQAPPVAGSPGTALPFSKSKPALT